LGRYEVRKKVAAVNVNCSHLTALVPVVVANKS